jgi:AAHS family 4-hydroxybenzoate transporter-like MFS transporter
MRFVANRDHPMTLPGRRISSEEPSAEAAILRSPDSGNPAVMDIAGLINQQPLSSFQKGIMVLIGGVIVMDRFDVQAIGFVAPALTQDWHIDPTALGPTFGAGLLGMLFGSMLLLSPVGSATLTSLNAGWVKHIS